jgi:hypothetical protein
MTNLTGPVFLLAGGGRTGSTLAQRLVLSTRQVMMWGEHGGILLPQLRELFRQIDERNKNAGGYNKLPLYRTNPKAVWVANMNPDPAFFIAGCRAFLDQSLGAAARQMGYSRWGFKEIRYGSAEALTLQRLFPRASFILLVRNPADCLRSIKGTDWYAKDYGADPAVFLEEWSRLSGELAEVQARLQRACLVRYEDLVSAPAAAVDVIARTIGVPASAFDLSVLEKVMRGPAAASESLGKADIEALLQPGLQSLASQFGYPRPGLDS